MGVGPFLNVEWSLAPCLGQIQIDKGAMAGHKMEFECCTKKSRREAAFRSAEGQITLHQEDI
jgi:hypothetical protein